MIKMRPEEICFFKFQMMRNTIYEPKIMRAGQEEVGTFSNQAQGLLIIFRGRSESRGGNFTWMEGPGGPKSRSGL